MTQARDSPLDVDHVAGRLIAVDVSSTFGALVGQLEYSMLIVTVRAGEQLAGCLVGFGCQTSIDPPRFLICLSQENHTYRVAMSAPELAVHFVPRQADALVRLFGGRTGDVRHAARRAGGAPCYTFDQAKRIEPGHPA